LLLTNELFVKSSVIGVVENVHGSGQTPFLEFAVLTLNYSPQESWWT
jgi:hypothetical protein